MVDGSPAGVCLRRPGFVLYAKRTLLRILSQAATPAGRSFPRDGKGTKGSPGEPSERFPGAPPPGQGGPFAPPLDPPAYVSWSRWSAQNSRPPSPVQAPGEAYASPGRGGAIEHLQVFPAPSLTGKTKPARVATTRRSPFRRQGGFPKGTAFPIIPAKRMLRREEEERPNACKLARLLHKPRQRSPRGPRRRRSPLVRLW